MGVASVCVVLAALITTAEAALSAVSKSRAERLLSEGRGGGKRLLEVAQDPAPYLNTCLLYTSRCV